MQEQGNKICTTCNGNHYVRKGTDTEFCKDCNGHEPKQSVLHKAVDTFFSDTD